MTLVANCCGSVPGHASVKVAEVDWHAVFPEHGVLGAISSNRLIANARDTDDLTVVSGSESKSLTNGGSSPLDMGAALPGERAALLSQYMASTFVDSGFGMAASPIAGPALALSALPDLLTSPHSA